MAELQLLNLDRMHPGARLYGVFLERIGHFRKHPPPVGWDGTWIAETK
jgi:adenylate cyclase